MVTGPEVPPPASAGREAEEELWSVVMNVSLFVYAAARRDFATIGAGVPLIALAVAAMPQIGDRHRGIGPLAGC